VDGLRVQHLYDYYLDLLAYEIERNHVSAHSRILIKIFQLLPLLGPINAEQAVAIMNLRVDAPPGWWRVCVVKMAVFGQRTFPDICPIYEFAGYHFVGRLVAMSANQANSTFHPSGVSR